MRGSSSLQVSSRASFWLAILLASSLGVLGCPKKDKLSQFDADAKSGADGKRPGAQTIATNTAATDEVNFDLQDQTDWKQVQLKGKPGILTVELRWDSAQADLNCDVFDSFGEQIAASPGPTPGAQLKRTVVQIDSLGVYYLRIQAAKKGDSSVYTVRASWEGEEVAITPPPLPPPQPSPRSRPHASSPRPERKERHFDADHGVQGRIVSSYRDAGQLVLHIDKGSGAGVKVGSTGTILEGANGSNALEGGTFTVVQVIDDNKSVAKTGLKSLGRNTRVLINAGK